MKPLEDVINALDPGELNRLIRHLCSFVSEDRLERINRTLDLRTRHLTVVLEDAYQPQNASAVLRTCECFGIQDVHVVESDNPFRISVNVVQGAAKWLTLYRYRGDGSIDDCLRRLEDRGYRLAAMVPGAGAVPIDELPVDTPLALCFGSEDQGLSARARSLADLAVAIPMHGFTASLNLSVSAGIAVQRLSARLRSSRAPWGLAPEERDRLRALWLARSAASGRQIVRRYLSSKAG